MNRYPNNRNRSPMDWLRREYARRPKPLWMVITADALLLVVALLVFALFHHVLPRNGTSTGLVSSRDAAVSSREAIASTGSGGAAMVSGGAAASIDLDAMTASDQAFGDDAAAEEPQYDAQDDESAEEDISETTDADATETSGGGVVDQKAQELIAAGTVTFSNDGTAGVPGDFSQRFADKFTNGEVIRSETGYESRNVNVRLTRYQSDEAVFYLADIYIRDISCLVTALAKGTYGRGIRQWVSEMSASLGAIIAINGDYYGGRDDGIVIRNGELYRADDYPVRDVCVLFWDGTMETYTATKFDAQAAINAGAYQAWNFGPRLLEDDGSPMTEFNSDVGPSNPRTALGYYEPRHYCFVVVEGRKKGSKGMTLTQLSSLMHELGCARAYNMDGGNTSQIVVGNKLINSPSGGGRATSDIIAIVDP